MPKRSEQGVKKRSRDQQFSQLVAAIVEHYGFEDKFKIGLRACLTMLCQRHGIHLKKPLLRNLKAIKDPAERKVVRATNEKVARTHENAQLLDLAKHFAITTTHRGKKVDRLGIFQSIVERTRSYGMDTKRRRTQGPAGGSPGMVQGMTSDGGSVPVPLSPTKRMPPPATARPVMPVADALSASCDLSILIAAAEAVA